MCALGTFWMEKLLCRGFLPNPAFAVALVDSSSPQALPPVFSSPVRHSLLSPNILERICCTFWLLLWEPGNTMWKDCPHLGGV